MENMTDADYFAHKAIDQTQLKQFLNDPTEWAYNRLHPGEPSSAAFTFGTAFHAHTMHTSPTVVTYPDGMNPLTKAGKQWKTEQEDAGNLVISGKDYQLIQLMESNLEPDDRKLIDSAECEKAVILTDKETQLPVKIKVDVLPTDTNLVIDLKTTSHLDDFEKSMLDYGYHIQAAFYIDMLKQAGLRDATRFEFWSFQKTGSGDYRKVMLTTVDDGSDSYLAFQAGRAAYRDALAKMRKLMDALNAATIDELAAKLWNDRRVEHSAQGLHLKQWQRNMLAV